MLRREKSVEMGHFGPIKGNSRVGFHSALNQGLPISSSYRHEHNNNQK